MAVTPTDQGVYTSAEVPPAQQSVPVEAPNNQSSLITNVAAMVLMLAVLLVAYLSKNDTLLTTVITAIITAVMIMVNFQYGSSAGSQKKDVMLNQKGQLQ
jgi:uncharacterized membrane protein